MNAVNIHSQDSKNKAFLIIVLSLVFSFYYIDLGFALKPYMLISIALFFYYFKSFAFQNMRLYEVILLIFFVYYGATGLFSAYPSYSLRMILGIILVLFCYFVMRYIVSRTNIIEVEKSIVTGGIIYNFLSLILYLFGILSLGFDFSHARRFIEYGVMVDLGLPRLVGLTNDPNMFVFYNLIFFFYFITHLKNGWSKIGLLLASSTIILSLSRAGILAITISLFVMVIRMGIFKKIRLLIVAPLFLFTLNEILKLTVNFDVFKMIVDRFKSITADGGSGRLEIWSNGLYFFQQNPLFGIGIFNFRPLNQEVFGKSIYMHNTFLESLVEGGVIGFALYCLVFITIFITYLYYRKIIDDNNFLILTFVALTIFMATYSMMINEMFFLFLVLFRRYLYTTERQEEKFHYGGD